MSGMIFQPITKNFESPSSHLGLFNRSVTDVCDCRLSSENHQTVNHARGSESIAERYGLVGFPISTIE